MSTRAKLLNELVENPTPEIILIGVNHKTADIALREKLYFNEEQSKKALELIASLQGVKEVSILCTCNRTEICLATTRANAVLSEVEQVVSTLSGCSDFSANLYVHRNDKAVQHIFEVACGLDSLIPGEQQIAAQQKNSYLLAKEQGVLGHLLNRLYQRAFGISKKVRSQTAIGRKAVSVSYAAKELSKQIFGDLSEVSVMLIGAGATGTLAAKYFRSAGVKNFFIVNRSIDKALELAKLLGGQAADLDNFNSLVPLSDIIIGASSIDSGDYLLSTTQLKKFSKNRDGVAQFLIDLGMPRNFDPLISELSDVFLYSLDDLEKVVSDNINSRTMEFDRAKLIINEEVLAFRNWYLGLSRIDNIKELVSYCEKLARDECDKTMSRLKKAGFAASQSSELKIAVDALASSILSKVMHYPIKAIKENNAEIEEVFKELIKKST